MKKSKLIGISLCALLACGSVAALAGCGGSGNEASSGSEPASASSSASSATSSLSSLVGTRWNLDRVILNGQEKTAAEYIASDAKYQSSDQFVMEVKDDINLYLRTYRDGKVFEEQQVLYTYKDGVMQVSSPGSTCTLEGDTLSMIWDNGDHGFIFKKA